MNVVSTVYLNGCNYQIGYDVLSQSVDNNTSSVRFYGVLNVTNGWVSWTSGNARVYDETWGVGTYYTRGSYTVVQKDVTLQHDDNGDYSGYLTGALNTTFTSGSCEGPFTLPHINRGATINTFVGNDVDGDFKATYTKRAEGFTYKLRLSIPNVYSLQTFDNYESDSIVNLNTTAKDYIYNYAKTNHLESVPIGAVIETYSGTTKIMESSELINQCSLGSISKIRIDGTWKRALTYVRVNGTWKRAIPYIRNNNEWKRGK